jgi:hypothetical protein
VVRAAGGDLVLDVGAAVDLGDDRAQPLARRREAERGGDRRLADAALAGDVDEPVVEDRYASPSQ